MVRIIILPSVMVTRFNFRQNTPNSSSLAASITAKVASCGFTEVVHKRHFTVAAHKLRAITDAYLQVFPLLVTKKPLSCLES